MVSEEYKAAVAHRGKWHVLIMASPLRFMNSEPSEAPWSTKPGLSVMWHSAGVKEPQLVNNLIGFILALSAILAFAGLMELSLLNIELKWVKEWFSSLCASTASLQHKMLGKN